MCGRYYIDTEEDIIEMREIIDEVNRKYHGTETLAKMKTGEIYPTDTVPIITKSGAACMTWGMPLHGKTQPLINARAETAGEKPMFRQAVKARRIVVPTNGFFEWDHAGGKATDKYRFKAWGRDMLYLAGLYTEYDQGGVKVPRFVILTTAANDSVRMIHHRMPVCLAQSELAAWMTDDNFAAEALHRFQMPLAAEIA